MMPKDHPCVRDCPGRHPGCNCERLIAYNERKEQESARLRLAKTVDRYQTEAVRRSKRIRLHRGRRIL